MLFVRRFLSRALGKLSRIALSLARASQPHDTQEKNAIQSARYNMVAAPDESYFAEQYWQIMLPHLKLLSRSAQVLDLGCGQGRFLTRMSRLFYEGQIVGCDLSPEAIIQAKLYAGKDAVANVDFRLQSIAQCVEGFGERSVEAVLMTEVAFFYPGWLDLLPRIIDTLKPGGLLIISIRAQYFDALSLVRERRWEDIQTLLKRRQGLIFGSLTVFTWQTSIEVKTLLVDKCGLELLELRGIGVCSGIVGDSHDYICRPSQLTEAEKARLMELELEIGKTVPDGGRYMLAVARKAASAAFSDSPTSNSKSQ